MPNSFRLLPIVLLFILTLSGAMLRSADAETRPTIQVTSVNYSPTVLPGMDFQVKINAWYSDRFLSDIGIWDVNSRLMVQTMTFISQFTGPGNVNFTLTLTAPRTPGTWQLLAINRVWWQNAWYQDPNGGERRFNVTVANNLTVTLGASGAAAEISVDGHPFPIQNGGHVSTTLKPGAHILAAPVVIKSSVNERYVFVGWSDGVNSDPQSIFLTEPLTIYALYRTEYYLSAQSEFGQIAGGGWYPKGTESAVAVTQLAATNQSGLAGEYRFTEWSGVSNSTSNVIVVTMDGPQQVTASWVEVGPTIDSNLIAAALLFLCLPLLGRLIFLRLKHGGKSDSTRYTRNANRRSSQLLLLGLLVLTLVLPLLPMANAQSLPQPRAAVANIGGAEWYYWGRPGSDTCIVWLGGGIPEEAEPGSYAYLINPFDYESFDTIRFIQDLSNFYCVIALRQGSVQAFDPTANRTIYQELFQPESTMLEDVHRWIIGQGYAHTFVVGYSVGGQAAVADLTLNHPEDWTTADGLVLITVPISPDVLNNAKELRTNLFLIYGGNLPDYESTGMQFYNGTQPEGVQGSQYYHKEFHVIDEAGHEVWTLRATGAYNKGALNLIIGFIETSKALQLKYNPQFPTGNSTTALTAEILSVQAPSTVNVDEAFVVQSNVSFKAPLKSLILAAYLPANIGILSDVYLTDNVNAPARIVIPPISKTTKVALTLVVLRNSSGSWVQASNTYTTTVDINDTDTLIVQTSLPELSFSFDGTEYSTNSSGLTEILTVPGQHIVEAQAFIYVSNDSRLRFVGWDDLTNQTSRQINLQGDRTIEISYVQQYLVQINSTYGLSYGSGWYDANSTFSALVQPPMLTSPNVIFSHWAGYGNDSQASALFFVTSPQQISAIWDNANVTPPPGQFLFDPTLILSILAFITLVILNIKQYTSKRKPRSSQRVT